jgi:UDP-glucose 4-epimerase
MLILVTGGAGFVGTNLIKQLSSDVHDIISIDNYSTGKKENHIEGVKYIDGDIYDLMDHIATLSTPYYQPDIVFHLAAIARIQPSFKNPKDYIRTNFNGTYNIVQFCASKGIPLIYAGSSSHHSGKFSNPYTFSKDMGEEVIQLYQKHFGLKSSTARFYNVYGPHQLTEGGYTTLIGRWLNNIKNNIQCEIYGDGTKRRDFTHVDDIVDALIKIIDKEEYGHIFELGREKNHSVLDVAKMFNINPLYKEDKPGEAQETLSDSSLAKNKLGWKPKINLEDYIYNKIKS